MAAAAKTAEDVLPFDEKELTALKQALKLLKKLLQREGFIEYNEDTNSVDIDTAANGIEKEATVCEKLGNVLKRIRPFDFDKFIKRCDEHRIACKELIGKDCVMFVGNTGIGKSTSIHYLMGSKMKQDPKRRGHVIPIKYSKELNRIQLLSQISNSVTSFIIPIKLNRDNGDSKNDNVYLCDTPGWNDSSTQNNSGGFELEIANLMGFVDAMNKCNRAAIMTFIASDEFTATGRAAGLKNVCEKLKLLLEYYEPEPQAQPEVRPDSPVPDSDESKNNTDVVNTLVKKLRNIKFVFTKVGRIKNADDLDDIGEDIINRMCTIANESQNQDLAVAKMIRDEKWNAEDVIPIDPLSEGVMIDCGDDGEGGIAESKDLREWTLRELFDDIDDYWIGGSKSNKRKSFRYNVPGQQIRMQIERVIAHIRNVLDIGTSARKNNGGLSVNFALIEKKLEQLTKLKQIFHRNENATYITEMVTKGVDDCIAMIEKKISDICDGQINKLKSYHNLSLTQFESMVVGSKEILDEFLTKSENIQVKYLTQDNTITTSVMKNDIENVFKTMLIPDIMSKVSDKKKKQIRPLVTSLQRALIR